MPDISTSRFVNGINSKGIESWQELIRDFYGYLVVYSMRFTGRRDVSEDIVQDVLVDIWEKERKFNSYHGFLSFLYRAVRNGSINHTVRRGVEHKYIDYSMTRAQIGEEEAELMRDELYRQLYKAVDQLPPRCREIFRMHLAGRRNDEIAAELNLSVETVKTQKKLATRQLKSKLGANKALLCLLTGIIPGS